jgi:RNA polymerase sigma factor (sigma-70 family)
MLTEDGYFISKCLNGETEAFGFLVDKYKASVYAFLYSRLRNFHDAEDVTQRVFVRAYEKLGTLSCWESFARWLYTIAYSQCRNFIRECQNRLDREFVEDQSPAVLRNLSMESYRDAQVSNSLREEVEEAMASLPEMYSQILILHYFGGMRVKEIATVLSITPTNVKKRLSRARAMLKEEMLAMMDTAFEGQRLQASFTFRIVESIKRIEIHPEPRITQVPWGLSMAAGIIFTLLSLGSHLSLRYFFDTPPDSASISNMEMTEASEFPVDVLDTFQITGYQRYNHSGESDLSFQQNAAPMAGNFPEKPSVQLGKGSILGDVHFVAFSPDGKLLASEHFGSVRLWDIQTQKQVGLLEGASSWPGSNSIVFTSDGKTIASIYDKEIYLFDVKEQRRIGILKGHTDSIHSLAISPDGKILVSTGNSDRTVRLWDIAKQKEIGVLVNGSWPHCADISPDGKIIAASIGGESLIRLWDIQTQKEIGVLHDPACAAWSVAFSPDGKTLASCNQCGEIRFWDVKKRKQIGDLEGLTISAYMTFSPDGKWLAYVNWEDRGFGTVRIWDIQEQKQIVTLGGHAGGINAVAFSPDGKWLASGSQGENGNILLWEVNIPVQGKSVEPTGKQLGKWGEIKETELFQNFPNPFNPETWIPYQLRNDAHVKFSIYNSTGKLVQLIDLGHKPAGSYMDKDKAVYWDGRNEAGEPVSSGTYFIHLSADSFSSTRKMVMIR